ncbi:MAG TPA: cation diffusion facilitator family transporter [Methanoregulaceae archaeon]|nr:cation diffusion facilitator family transporter [Methanoregulaceae archaeon]
MTDPVKDKASMDVLKQRTARLSVVSNTGLVILKFVTGFLTGSVSIISEAIHSSMDLIAAVIAFFAVRKSAEPPDSEHEFGHGKFEDMSGLIEAMLIFVAAALIIREAVIKLLVEEPEQFTPQMLSIGIAVMGFAVIVNVYVSSRLMKVAKQTDSIALESDAWHLRTDVYTSLGVCLGLVLIRLTGIPQFDPLVAICVAIVIMKAAYDLTKRSFSDLLDRKIPDKDEDRIKKIICDHASRYAGFHELKTRRSGPEIFIEFHLVVPSDVTVETSHDLTDHLESDLKLEFPRASVTIHVEPCNEGCDICGSFCNYKEKSGNIQIPEE